MFITQISHLFHALVSSSGSHVYETQLLIHVYHAAGLHCIVRNFDPLYF